MRRPWGGEGGLVAYDAGAVGAHGAVHGSHDVAIAFDGGGDGFHFFDSGKSNDLFHNDLSLEG